MGVPESRFSFLFGSLSGGKHVVLRFQDDDNEFWIMENNKIIKYNDYLDKEFTLDYAFNGDDYIDARKWKKMGSFFGTIHINFMKSKWALFN